jgi:pimeloyl-ACP methyl ester carboxylesterase
MQRGQIMPNTNTLSQSIRPSLVIVTRVAVQAARKRNPALNLILPTLRAVQSVSPSAAAGLAERLFFRAPWGQVSALGREFLARGNRFELAVDGRRVVGWTWGQGPTTYLVHGWGGCSGRLYSMAEALIATGRRLVMFDAPGHGASGRGLSSVPEFARSLKAVVERQGAPDVVVAHSLGAAATALAAGWGLNARRFVFLAPAANPADWARSIGSMLRLDKEVMRRLRQRSEQRLRFSWDDLDARLHARGMTAPLLVIHDHKDDTVPFSHGASIARSWPGATLMETSGLGHRDLLNDPLVISRVLDFVTEGPMTDEPVASAETWLEQNLFNREER